ncbi:MAG: hypothetical protein ACKOCA_00055 [Vulcanococcus sp.]
MSGGGWGRPLRLLLGAGLLLEPLLAAGARAQLPPPPPPPPPAAAEPDLGRCVASYGNTGCAARLYAQLLCDSIGTRFNGSQLTNQLDQQYAQAGIDFSGISPEQVERAAVRYYAPMLCPSKSERIRAVFRLS